MFFVSKSVAVLVISDSELCLAEFELHEKVPTLTSYSKLALPKGVVVRGAIVDRIQFVQFLKTALHEAKPHAIKTREVIVVLPEAQVYLTVLRFTRDTSPHEMLQETPREALSVIPLDQRQIYCDFFPVPHTLSTEDCEVIYCACDKTVASEYLETVLEVGLKPVYFAVEPDALVASLTKLPLELIVFLVIREDRSYFILVEDGLVKKSIPSSIQMSEALLAEPDATAQHIEGEVEALTAAYHAGREHASEVKRAVVYVMSPSLKALVSKAMPSLRNALALPVDEPTSELTSEDPAQNIAFGAARRFLLKGILGKSVDLLPVRFREQAALVMLDSFVTWISIMFIITSSALLSVFSYAATEMFFDHNRVQREVASISQNVQNPRFQAIKQMTQRFNKEVDVLSNIQRRLFSFDTLWKDVKGALFVKGIIPQSVQFLISDISFEITGTAKTREDLSRLKKRIESLSAVSEVISPLSNLDKTADISFLLTVKLNPKKIPFVNT